MREGRRVGAFREDEEREQRGPAGETGPQVRVVQRPGRKARPPVVPGGRRVDRGERGERDGGQEDRPRRRPGLYFFSFSQRSRMKDITVLARAGGISVGFNIFNVFPVTRYVARKLTQGGHSSKWSWSSRRCSSGMTPSSYSRRQSRTSFLQVISSCFIPPPARPGDSGWRPPRASGGHRAGPGGAST